MGDILLQGLLYNSLLVFTIYCILCKFLSVFPLERYLDAGQPEVVQRGSPWYEKLSFSYLSASDTLSPGGGSYWNASLWGPIWVSFFFISYPKWSFLTFNLQAVSAHFWPPRFFILTDGMGWMGWTDGSVEVEKTSLSQISRKLLNIFSWLFWPL